MKMKVLTRLICFLVLQTLLVIPSLPIMEASLVSSQTQANDQSKKVQLNLSSTWPRHTVKLENMRKPGRC